MKKMLAEISEKIAPKNLESLKLRNKIMFTMRRALNSIRSLTYMYSFIYVVVILSIMFFIGIYLHFLSEKVINYQLSQTLYKIQNYAATKVEEELLTKLNFNFECCSYPISNKYNQLSQSNCSFSRGCLRPLQEFMWEYLYFSVVIFLAIASFKLCIILVSVFNFRVILVSRLFKKLYEVNVRKYRFKYQELNCPDEEEGDDDEDEIQTKERYVKLQEIREKKFEMLQKEEDEELLRKEREEAEINKFLEAEKKQEAYEMMLLKQKRFDEYQYQQLQRKIQLQHFLERNENNFED